MLIFLSWRNFVALDEHVRETSFLERRFDRQDPMVSIWRVERAENPWWHPLLAHGGPPNPEGLFWNPGGELGCRRDLLEPQHAATEPLEFV